MFPGLGGGLDPKKMQALMKQMGINQDEIQAKRVIIEMEDSRIVINDPSVVKIDMKGQVSFQVSGDVSEEASSGNSAEDVKTIIEKTGCSEEEAVLALEKTGDLTEAILSLG